MNRRVDRKLHFTALTLAAIDANLPHTSALETALVEAALLHLHIAYRAYLRELLLHCQVADEVETAQQAVELLHTKQLQSSDIDELAKLERSGAWPAQLCFAYADAVACEMDEKPAARGGIMLCDVTASVNRDAVATWLHQFQTLLRRQREHAQEW